ncbi:DUF6193 family natural product biosynthesis protein [Actinospica robiniae]|uniref:DUF6193 family natural product biosynthesis protein n=1 Tax=Actinospica robiniae TaxID=304901 RepID=UPI000554CEF4
MAAAWRNELEQTPHTRHGTLLMAQAAYGQPRLRALYPFYSHGALHFLTTVPPPWPRDLGEPDLPFILEGGPPYSVCTAGYAELLGEAATPEEGVALLVANLPPDVGVQADH